ncbi:MAG TPA: type II secretion system protein N [Sphingomonadaceae bacterium]|nr:type II secretion system protein N [Sphingomonadaceae bacterium]
MRVRLPLGRGLFFLCAFLFAGVALLPLRLAADWLRLGDTGVAAREAVGSVWAGALHGAQFRDAQLGDLLAGLDALPLLVGRARIEMERNRDVLARAAATPDRFEAAVTVSRNSFALSDATARLALGAQWAPLPITAIDLSDVSARFVGGQCAAAEGAVTVETSGRILGLAIPTSMTGNARCDGGALLLPLAGAGGAERLDLRLPGGDRYRATLSIQAADPALQQRLAAAGFVAAGGVYSLSIEGRLQ